MSELLTPEPTAEQKQALLIEWDAAVKAVVETKVIIESERVLRKRVAAAFFPEPKEGTNKLPLAEGWVLKYTYPMNREVDPGALAALAEPLRAAGVFVDKLVEYNPKLVTSEYRELTAEQASLFDQALIIKPGSAGLVIELPAKAKKAAK